MEDKKILIAFYSRAGFNYRGGQIVDLPVGNTEVAAATIQKLTGGDLFKIDTVASYPADYHECTEVAKDELRTAARPELVANADVTEYDVIILGYPNWWGTMPMAVCTFLEGADCIGKTIAPFCTHEGSGMGRSEKDIRKFCPGAKILNGLAIRGSDTDHAESQIAGWLKDQGLSK